MVLVQKARSLVGLWDVVSVRDEVCWLRVRRVAMLRGRGRMYTEDCSMGVVSWPDVVTVQISRAVSRAWVTIFKIAKFGPFRFSNSADYMCFGSCTVQCIVQSPRGNDIIIR